MAPVSPPGGTFMLGGDLEVGRLGFGSMRITNTTVDDAVAARKLLRRVVDAGVNLIDTADSYGPEVSENLIAESLHPYPDSLVITTKGGYDRPDQRWEPACRPERLRRCCEDSLRRLKLDRIDLYQLHTVDPKVPVEDSVGALAELQDEGKIRHIGVSNVSREELERARAIAEVVSVQNPYNLSDRASEDLLEVCERDGLAFMPYYPLAAGQLSQAGGQVGEIARSHDATPGQVALAWLLAHSPVMLPIPGTSRLAHFEENLEAVRLELSDHEIAALESG
jgi:aryl-alcohol dehydrogenase-like predicted oxidoreductase